MDYTFIADLAAEAEIPADGTLSRTIHHDDVAKVVLFAFDAGQELSDHKASRPAIIHVVKGRLTLTLDGEAHDAPAGSFAHMPAGLPHALRAEAPTVMVLTLLGR